jgi:hypothetical protein
MDVFYAKTKVYDGTFKLSRYINETEKKAITKYPQVFCLRGRALKSEFFYLSEIEKQFTLENTITITDSDRQWANLLIND